MRWVTAESLHVTLKFIGEKPEGLLDQIRESLASISAPSFSVAFRGCGFFPTPRAARVFWIGIEADSVLAKLAGQIDDVLAELEIPKEARAFSPHLTLARAGSGAPQRKKSDQPNQRFARLTQKLSEIPAPDFGTMTARDFFLYRSHVSSRGSQYEKIARFELH